MGTVASLPSTRHHHVPRYRRQDAEGDHRPRPLHHQDQDYRSPREEVLRLDRWLHPGLPLHLPADVDLQAGVRRVRPLHCPPQVLLSTHLQPRRSRQLQQALPPTAKGLQGCRRLLPLPPPPPPPLPHSCCIAATGCGCSLRPSSSLLCLNPTRNVYYYCCNYDFIIKLSNAINLNRFK